MKFIAGAWQKKVWQIAIVLLLILTGYSGAVTGSIQSEPTNLAFAPGGGSDDPNPLAPDVFNEYFTEVRVELEDSNDDKDNDTAWIIYDVTTEGVSEQVEVFLDVFNNSGNLIATYSESFLTTRNPIGQMHKFDFYAKYSNYYNFSLRLYDVTHNKKENYGNNYEISKVWLDTYKSTYELFVQAQPLNVDSDRLNDDVMITVKDSLGMNRPGVAVYIDASLRGTTDVNGSLSSTNFTRGYHEVDVFLRKLHANTDFKSEGDARLVPFLVDSDPDDFEGSGVRNDAIISAMRENGIPVRDGEIYIDGDFYGTTSLQGTLMVWNLREGFHYVNVKAVNQNVQSVFYSEQVTPSTDYDEFFEYVEARAGNFDNGELSNDIQVNAYVSLEGGPRSNVTMNATLTYLNYTELETKSIDFTVTQREFNPEQLYFYNLSEDSYRIFIELFDSGGKLEDAWLIDEIAVTLMKGIVNIDRGAREADNIGTLNDLFFYSHIAADPYTGSHIIFRYSSNDTFYRNVTMDDGYTISSNFRPDGFKWTAYDDSNAVLETGEFNIYPQVIIDLQTTESLTDDDFDGYYDDFRVDAYDSDGNEISTVYVYVWDENSLVFKEGYSSVLTPGGPGVFLVKNIPEGNYTYEARTTTPPQRVFSNGSFYSYGNNTEAGGFIDVFATVKDIDNDGMNDVVVKVVNYANNPVPGARVYFDRDMSYYDTTDSNGEVTSYDFEYGWHHVDAYNFGSSPRGHAYTQFLSEGFDYDEYFFSVSAYQTDADYDGDMYDLEIYADVDLNVDAIVEVTVDAYLYYQENSTFYNKTSETFLVQGNYNSTIDGILYFYDLPLNTTFNATYRLFDEQNNLEDEWNQTDIYIRKISPRINVDVSYYTNLIVTPSANGFTSIPSLGFHARQEIVDVRNVNVKVYRASDDELVYDLTTNSNGIATTIDENFEYTEYYWKAYNQTGSVVEDEGRINCHQNISFLELLFDRDEDGYFDDFYFHSYWTEVITTPQGIQIPQSSINVTLQIYDTNKQLILKGYTEDNLSFEIFNLTKGDYYFRMDYKGTMYDYGEFYSQGNGFDNLEPSVEIGSPIDNSDYYDNELISFDGTGSSDPDYYDRLTYDWRSNIDGWLSSTSSFNSYLSPGFHTITLGIDDAHGHVNTTTVGVNITTFATPNTAPVVVISSPTEGASFGASTAIYFDGANSTDEVPANLTFTWSSNITGTLGGNNSKFSMALEPGAHQISLMVEDGGGLNSSDLVNITVTNSAPVAVIDSPLNGSFFNASDFVWLNASSSYDPDGEDLTYIWSSNISGFLSSKVNQSKRLKSGLQRINLTVTDPNSVSDTASVEVTVTNRRPVIYDAFPPEDDLTIMEKEETFLGLKFNDTFVDIELVVELYVDGLLVDFMDAVNHDIWLWEQSIDNVGKFYYGYFNFSYQPSYMSAGDHNIKVRVVDDDVFTMVQWNITVQNKNRAPTAIIGSEFVDEITISLNDEIELNGSRSNDDDDENLTYVWDFDATDGTDQQDDTGPIVMKEFTLPGDFIITLTVDDGQSDNSTGIDNLTVHVNRAPIAVAGPDMTRTKGDLVYFNASGSSDPDDNNLTYKWDFGTGDTDFGMNVSYTYDTVGVYTVSLNVTDNFAWNIDTLEITIKESNLPPQAKAGAIKKITVNLNEAVTFNGSGSSDPDGDILIFTWDFDATDGTDDVDATGLMVQHTYTAYGEYIVTLTVDDNNGGIDTDNLTITVNQPPTAAIVDVVGGYVGERISFDASDSNDPELQILSYDWNFGDGTSNVTGKTVNHIFMLPDDYTVTLTVEDPNGAKDVATIDITIVPIPVPVILQPSSGTKIFGDVEITGSATGPTVKRVQVKLISDDGSTNKVIGTVPVTNGAWELTWDSTAVENGDYKLEARSTDNNEEYWSAKSIQVSIEVENEESIVDDVPAPTLNETDEGFLDSLDILGIGTIGVLALCGVGILIIIILIGVMVMRSGSRRKRAPAEALRAAQMDSFRPVMDTGDGLEGDVDVEGVDEEEKPEPEGEERPIKCPSCGDIFLSRDTGDRPWMLWCTQCGARGIIKGKDYPGLPPGEDDEKSKKKKADHQREKVKCPDCSEIFSVWSDDKEIECPNCGISGEK